jgi:hypothetical protein
VGEVSAGEHVAEAVDSLGIAVEVGKGHQSEFTTGGEKLLTTKGAKNCRKVRRENRTAPVG